MEERLQKVLARAGYAGRLKCEDLILQGLVTVNGRVVRELGFKVDPRADEIEVVGERLRIPDAVCWLLNKPAGVVSTTFDPEGRPRAVDYFQGHDVRVFPVGRLDVDSTGLLLMTNDGDLSNRLTHPRYGLEKTYLVEVDGLVGRDVADGLVAGVWMSDGKAHAARVRIVYAARNRSTLEIVLKEGRNRQIRRMLAKFGHKVRRLTRIRMGPLSLGNLKPGTYRKLTEAELAAVRAATEAASAKFVRDSDREDRPRSARNGPRPQSNPRLGGRPSPRSGGPHAGGPRPAARGAGPKAQRTGARKGRRPG